MLPSFDKLTRMLIQERRLDYKNKAVMGGLEKFAPNWVAEAQQEATTAAEQQVIEEVLQDLQRYSNIPEAERPNVVHQMMVKLHKAGEASTNGDEETPGEAESSPVAPEATPEEAATSATKETTEAQADPAVEEEPVSELQAESEIETGLEEPAPFVEETELESMATAIEAEEAFTYAEEDTSPPEPKKSSPPFSREPPAYLLQHSGVMLHLCSS